MFTQIPALCLILPTLLLYLYYTSLFANLIYIERERNRRIDDELETPLFLYRIGYVRISQHDRENYWIRYIYYIYDNSRSTSMRSFRSIREILQYCINALIYWQCIIIIESVILKSLRLISYYIILLFRLSQRRFDYDSEN
jgi:hypothetical protein